MIYGYHDIFQSHLNRSNECVTNLTLFSHPPFSPSESTGIWMDVAKERDCGLRQRIAEAVRSR
jgi:hypothetical protein